MEGHTLARMRSVDMAVMSHVGSCRTLAPAVAASPRRVAPNSPLSTPQTQTQTTGKIVHNDRRAHLQFVPPLLFVSIGQDSLLRRKKPRSRETEGVPGWFDSLGFSSRARLVFTSWSVHCRTLTSLFTTALPARASISVPMLYFSAAMAMC